MANRNTRGPKPPQKTELQAASGGHLPMLVISGSSPARAVTDWCVPKKERRTHGVSKKTKPRQVHSVPGCSVSEEVSAAVTEEAPGRRTGWADHTFIPGGGALGPWLGATVLPLFPSVQRRTSHSVSLASGPVSQLFVLPT